MTFGSAQQILFGLGILLVLQTGGFGQYRERITSVQITSGSYVIASDASNGAAGYNRDTIKVTTSAEFERLASGSAGTLGYRVCFELMDPSGNVVQLVSGGGTAISVCSNPSPVTYGAIGVVIPKSGNNELTPADPLIPNTLYHIRATLQRTDGTKWGSVDTKDSSSQSFFHFTSTVSSDAAPNALAEITNIEWLEYSALDTAPGTDAQSFKARITFDAYRYDGFSQGSPATTLVPFNVSYLIRESGTNAAKAVENGSISPGWNLAQFVWQGGVRVPKVRTGLVVTVHVNPSEQLTTFSKQHYLSVNVSHSEGGDHSCGRWKERPSGNPATFQWHADWKHGFGNDRGFRNRSSPGLLQRRYSICLCQRDYGGLC